MCKNASSVRPRQVRVAFSACAHAAPRGQEEIQDVQRRCAAKAKHLEENYQRIKEVVKLVEDLRKAVWDVWESNGKTKDGKFNISSVVSSLQVWYQAPSASLVGEACGGVSRQASPLVASSPGG